MRSGFEIMRSFFAYWLSNTSAVAKLKRKKTMKKFIGFSFLVLSLIAGAIFADRYDLPSHGYLWLEKTHKQARARLFPKEITRDQVLSSLKNGNHSEEFATATASDVWDQHYAFRQSRNLDSRLIPTADIQFLVKDLGQRIPDQREFIIESADQYSRDLFSPFSTEPQKFGEDFDWNSYPARDDDIIFIWEINTLQHFPILAQAYLLTEDAKYLSALERHIESWTASNPVDATDNWAVGMEASIRLVSLVWTKELLRQNPAAKNLVILIENSSLLHADFILKKIKERKKFNNHAIFSAFGLYFYSVFHDEFAESAQYRAVSDDWFVEQVLKQFDEEGVHAEYAPTYHLALLDGATQYLLLQERFGDTGSPQIKRIIERAIETLFTMSNPADEVYLLGDSDDHVLQHVSDLSYRDISAVAQVASLLFEKAEWDRESPAALWRNSLLIGRVWDHSPQRPATTVDQPVEQFSSGFAKLRKGPIELFVSFAPQGRSEIFFGHSHADSGTFFLAHNGLNIVSDPGTLIYMTSEEDGVKWRSYMRSSQAHSVTTVDGKSQADGGGEFTMSSRPESRILRADEFNSALFALGEHEAYSDVVGVSRRLFFVVDQAVLTFDWYPGAAGTHAYETRILLDNEKVLSGPASSISIRGSIPGQEAAVVIGNLELPAGWISKNFGTRTPTAQWISSQRIGGPAVVGTAIIFDGCCNDLVKQSSAEPAGHDAFHFRTKDAEYAFEFDHAEETIRLRKNSLDHTTTGCGSLAKRTEAWEFTEYSCPP